MFEAAEVGQSLSKEEYKARVPLLRTELLRVQSALMGADFPVLILISGVDGAGKGDVINLLNEWLDPRFVRTWAFGLPGEEELERPPFWRFWQSLPPKGRIGLYVGSWYSEPIGDRVHRRIGDAKLDARLARIRAFEKALADDGALILKFWLHLGKTLQRERMTQLEKNPATAWRVTPIDKEHLKLYDRFRRIAERAIRETSTGDAPWNIVECSDERFRNVRVAEEIIARLDARLTKGTSSSEPLTPPPPTMARTILNTLDLSRHLQRKEYENLLEKYQGRLGQLVREARERKISSIMVLEGWDAAGKGGIIRRAVHAMDARNYCIIPIAAPTDEERAHHWLWRFWRHIPRRGRVTIYDRSWYGRVLVERAEGFASPSEWMRAYAEINDFEEQLEEHGVVLMKFWVHMSKDEQLRRFQEREQVPFKQYKITAEDYRNREKWEAYEQAVNEMIERTSTEFAPWVLVEGNDKGYARIKVLKEYCRRLEEAIEGASS